VASKDIIAGTWNANGNSGDLLISYSRKRIKGFYTYLSIGRKESRALIIEDSNRNGAYDKYDNILGMFSARTNFITTSLPTIASGRFNVNTVTGSFNLFYGSKKFGTGLFYSSSELF